MTFGWKYYFEPTPKVLRKLGDALVAASSFILGYALIQNYHSLGFGALLAGCVGHFITNFFGCKHDDKHS